MVARGPRPKTLRDRDELRSLLECDMSVADAAEELQLSVTRVYALIKQFHLKELLKRTTKWRDDMAVKAYEEGTSLADITEQFEISVPILYKKLRERKIPLRNRRTPKTTENNDLIVKMYQEGAVITEICYRAQCSPVYLYKILRVRGIALRR